MGILDGATAIVTGASSGIGAATAVALAGEGARVVGGARRVERLETDVSLALDVTDPESCARFVEQAGSCDILVNAAGLALGRVPVDQSTEADEETVFATNVNGLVRMTRLVLQHRCASRGTSSTSGRSPDGGRTRTRPATSPRSSRCAGSRGRCARTCSGARSG